MSFKKAFLPVGLILATAAALTLPSLGILMQDANMVAVFVIIIFVVNGWEFRVSDVRLDKRFIKAFLACSIISLLLGPIIGSLIADLFTSDPLFAMGLIVMSSVPVTLSSAIVLSEISGGNRAWALLLTIGINLLGIFTMPFMVEFMLTEADDLEISALNLLTKLILLVLLPFLAGVVLRRLLSRVRSPKALQYVPSTCVILTVYASLAAARETLFGIPWPNYPSIAIAASLIHLILMGIALGSSKLMHLGKPERNTVLFIASQKTLPIAISAIVVIAPESAIALVPCLLFHFIQLFFDSFVASHLSPKHI